MSTKLYLLFTVVKDKKKIKIKLYISVKEDANIRKSWSQPLKPSLPFSHMNYSGRARDVKRDQTSPCERWQIHLHKTRKGFPFDLLQDLVVDLWFFKKRGKKKKKIMKRKRDILVYLGHSTLLNHHIRGNGKWIYFYRHLKV